MTFEKAQLRQLFESAGVKFRDNRVVIDLGAKGTLAIDEHLLLEPSEKNFRILNDTMKREFGVEFELFDLHDKRYQVEFAGNYERYFGRVHHHDEYVGFPPRLRRYYRYVKMTAPMSEVSSDSWEKMAQYLACVIVTLGILVFLGIISSGTSVAASVALFSAVAAACIAAVAAVNQSEKEAANITLPIER